MTSSFFHLLFQEGIGSLRVVPGGVELRGQATILDALVASSLKSRKGRNLVLESWSNFTASARSHDGRLLARFTLGKINLLTKIFDYIIVQLFPWIILHHVLSFPNFHTDTVSNKFVFFKIFFHFLEPVFLFEFSFMNYVKNVLNSE